MDWNYKGIGNTKVVTEIFSDGFKIYYYDEISIENYYDEDKNFIVKDRKMWNMTGNKLDFYHFRNNRYERILEFVFIDDKFVLRAFSKSSKFLVVLITIAPSALSPCVTETESKRVSSTTTT